MTPLETVVTHTLLWATTGAAAAIPVFFLPQPGDPLLSMTVHLVLVAVYGMGLAFHLAPLAEPPWFTTLPVGTAGRQALSWTVVTAAVTVSAGVTTVATGVALRYDPSTQFLLLLAALHVVWWTTGAVLGTRRRFGGTIAMWIGIALSGVLVAALWRHLDAVGFTPAGGWRLDGAEMLKAVGPWALGGSAVAVALFATGVRAAAQD